MSLACVYCQATADSRDHVPPRCLLEKPYPPNLWTVPSCVACNRGFSLDEEYFLAALASIGTSPAITSKQAEGGIVDRMMNRSPGLEATIVRSLRPVPEEGGRVYIDVEMNRIERVIQKIALGIFVKRYGRIPDITRLAPVSTYPYNIKDMRSPWILMSTHTEQFQPKRWNHLQPQVFSYITVRSPFEGGNILCVMDFHSTLWGVVPFPRAPGAQVDSDKQLPLFDRDA